MSFKQSILTAIEENQNEMIIPSREYTSKEITWMSGYTQALKDMIEDYDNDIEDAIKKSVDFSLN
jgi:hypothetical protein